MLKGIFCLYPYRKEIEPQYLDMRDMLGSYVFCSFKRQMGKKVKEERTGYFCRHEI
jgi:hypothetical protein